ncbi:rRNA processing protein Rrp8 [Cladophialophora carrionii]|uniref:Ribosomal RNA-processing protein 8 n=1 Tax=Cladophialophora carrionii TaxID=86049 RepID=A0A1C1CR80_9EURO|nr:rRNA processing protein Rrp8 [Cladophialophora carrionii]
MFSVPGWSVDSTSLVQEKPATKSHTQASSAASGSTSSKRKSTLAHSDQASKVSGSELERLWNEQAAANPTRSKKKKAQGEETNHKRRETGKRDVQRLKQHKTGGNEAAAAEEKKYSKNKDKHREDERDISKHRRQSVQEKGDRTSKDTRAGLSNGDAETFSSARDQVLKTLPPAPPPAAKLTALQAKMRSKLTSARFRHLNETLYTTSSAAALDLFTNSPDLFAEYHAGFSQQVKDSWPVNPVEKYIASIRHRGQLQTSDRDTKQRPLRESPLPRRPKTSLCTIADLGCGDAPLARGCQSVIKSHKLKFHNFDLHAPSTLVTKADISNLPLRDGEVDIAVFCLSLMGTNWISFVEEAWRILRGDGKGECWVSEVKSRFGRVGRQKGEAVDNSVGKRRKQQKPNKRGADGEDAAAALGEEIFAEDATEKVAGDETDISAFVKVFTRRGFQLREDSVDKSNKMFVSMAFIKSGIPTAGKHKGLKWTGREYQRVEQAKTNKRGPEDDVTPQEEAKVLKPCVYKTR